MNTPPYITFNDHFAGQSTLRTDPFLLCYVYSMLTTPVQESSNTWMNERMDE